MRTRGFVLAKTRAEEPGSRVCDRSRAVPFPERSLYGGIVPTLTVPSEDMRRSFAEAMAEFRAEGRGSEDDQSAIGRYLRTRAVGWSSDEAFSVVAASIRADALEETPRPEGYVPATEWSWGDGETFLGRITIRHRLTAHLLEVGGHIGYDVRPSARRRGHVTEMLRQTLAIARPRCPRLVRDGPHRSTTAGSSDLRPSPGPAWTRPPPCAPWTIVSGACRGRTAHGWPSESSGHGLPISKVPRSGRGMRLGAV